MSRQALKGCEHMLGKEHHLTLTIINNLGVVLAGQGKYEMAERMH
jgi:hypothetical protein